MIANFIHLLPASLSSACEFGEGLSQQSCAHSPMAGTALLAAVAALGYGVLHHAEKDHGNVKTAGQITGWVLLSLGLLGFLCGVFGHIVGSARCKRSAAEAPISMSMDLGEVEEPPQTPEPKKK
ncbi:MAG: hypothetical protein A2X36_16500 [Elusimicrobia bacterium GWA2_69_24]|nr:MAG: hypothetical protein A2X36_16500 [Elusimicrobia bacterium GWA2_69_24]HBL18721.1 hypothetical protein [Elusimicrobiota bacterium]